MPVSFDPISTEWRHDPYTKYRELRDKAPVHWAADRTVTVSRYDDVMHVLRTPEVFSSRAMLIQLLNGGYDGAPPLSWPVIKFIAAIGLKGRINPFGFANARMLIAEDGASHSSMRAIVNRGFSPRRIAAWEERAYAIVEECLAGVRRDEPFDVVSDLAVPVPVTIIAEMLGVPPELHAEFKHSSDMVIESASGPGRQDRWNAKYRTALVGFMRCIRDIVADRRKHPTDDLVSTLVHADLGEDALDTREIVQFALLLLVAGNETTTNLIGNTTAALLANREAMGRVAADPKLVPAALEETLRYDSPIQTIFRNTTSETELQGERIPAGTMVAVLLGAANRDERRFADPDRFDLDRDNRGHVGFGFGHHFCLGASLARLEARAALEGLAPLLPQLAGPKTPIETVDSFLVRGPTRLELRPAA
jgi:cytochrome P450